MSASSPDLLRTRGAAGQCSFNSKGIHAKDNSKLAWTCKRVQELRAHYGASIDRVKPYFEARGLGKSVLRATVWQTWKAAPVLWHFGSVHLGLVLLAALPSKHGQPVLRQELALNSVFHCTTCFLHAALLRLTKSSS